jgi:hypothetical protein
MTFPWDRWFRAKTNPTLLLFPLVLATNRAASQQLDQSNLISVAGGFASETVCSINQLAQTFKVGKSGTLSQINLQLYKLGDVSQLTHNVTFQLCLPPNPFTPLGSTLATLVLHPSDIPGFDPSAVQTLSLQVPTPPVVSAGQVLSLLLTSDQPFGTAGIYDWVISQSVGIDVYPPGTAWHNPNLAGFTSESPLDYGFQTYVSPVPEPSATALVGIGGLFIALWNPAFGYKISPKFRR